MAVIRRVHVPLKLPEDIIPHLGAAHHWKDGRSAKLLIDQWWTANDLPSSIRLLLNQAPTWRDATLIDAFAERCTNLEDGRPSHSQSDMLAVLGLDSGLGILSIEAKVDEGFDKLVDEWRGDGSAGKQVRLGKLCRLFGVNESEVGALRYQLFHRSASAVIEAKRYRAKDAVMIVQSWSSKLDGFADFSAFLEAIGLAPTRVGELSEPMVVDNVALRFGWSDEHTKLL